MMARGGGGRGGWTSCPRQAVTWQGGGKGGLTTLPQPEQLLGVVRDTWVSQRRGFLTRHSLTSVGGQWLSALAIWQECGQDRVCTVTYRCCPVPPPLPDSWGPNSE